MRYNLKDDNQLQAAFQYLSDLVGRHSVVDIKRVNENRSLNQNSYLHILIESFGEHFGYTAEEAKTVYKEINASTYMYKKNNRNFCRSSSDLSKEEMAKTIDKFIVKSAENGHPLPLATDKEWLRQIQNQVERSTRV